MLQALWPGGGVNLLLLAVVALTLLTEAALPVNEFPGDLPKRLLFGMASSSAIALLTRYG